MYKFHSITLNHPITPKHYIYLDTVFWLAIFGVWVPNKHTWKFFVWKTSAYKIVNKFIVYAFSFCCILIFKPLSKDIGILHSGHMFCIAVFPTYIDNIYNHDFFLKDFRGQKYELGKSFFFYTSWSIKIIISSFCFQNS